MKRISVLMATAFVDMIGFMIVMPLLPFYALRFDAPEWMVGWLIAAFSIMQLAAAPVWGRLSDRYGRRPALLLGLSISAVAFAIFAFATSIAMLFITRLIQGVAGGTTGVAQAYVGDAVEPKDRAKALGWLSAATSAGVMIGPAIGSLAYSFGPAVPGLVASGLCVINVLFALRWLPESSTSTDRAAGAQGAAAPVRRPIAEAMAEVLFAPRGDVPRLIWIYAVGMLGFMSMTSVLALYLDAQFGVTEATIGPVFVYLGMLSIVMRAVVLGKAVEAFGETRVMRTGAVLLTFGLAAMPLPQMLLGATLVMSLVPIGTALLFPNVSALVTHRARKEELGQTMSVQQSFGGVARVIAPLWATAAFQYSGMATPFFVSAAVVGVVTMLAFRVKPQPHPVEPAPAVGG